MIKYYYRHMAEMKENKMFATIETGSATTTCGEVVSRSSDGKVSIETRSGSVSGYPIGHPLAQKFKRKKPVDHIFEARCDLAMSQNG